MSPHSPLIPSWIGVLLVIGLLAAVVWAVRRGSIFRMKRAWENVAQELAGTLEIVNGKRVITGRYRGRLASLSEAVSHEDAIPYLHTCGTLNVMNPAKVVLGLRHKSLLEEFATRKETSAIETGDAEFDKTFFLVLTVPEHAEALFSSETRRTLKRFSDVEIYLRSNRLEWRRANTVGSAPEALALFAVLAEMAAALDLLPSRRMSLTEVLVEEQLIEKGV